MDLLIKKNETWECFFVRIVMIFGIIMILIVPIMQVQDEDAHTMRSINMSYLNFDYKNGFNILQSVYTFIETYTEGKGIYIFESEPDYRINHDIYWKATRIPINSDEKVFFCDGDGKHLRTAYYGNLAYLPQGIGIMIGRLCELPIFYALVLGRLFKLFFYTILCYWAIRLIPQKKKLVTILSLMPMPVFFAASLSPDGILISSCYLFISYCLYSKKKYQKLTKKGIILLVSLLILIFSVKMIYSSIALFLLIFVDKKIFFQNKKRNFTYAIISVSIILILTVCAYIISPSVKICLKNIPLTIYLYFKTYISNFNYYLSLGIANFGTGYCPFNIMYVYMTCIYIILVALQTETNEDLMIIGKEEKVISFIIFFIISVLIFFAGISMSKLDYLSFDSSIVGIQGRYFTPFILFALLIFSNNKVNLKWITNDYVVKLVSIILLTISNIWIIYRYW